MGVEDSIMKKVGFVMVKQDHKQQQKLQASTLNSIV